MSRSASRRKAVVVCSLLGVWATLVFACSVEDENPATSRSRTDASTEGSTSTGDTDAPTGAPICAKYGGYDKVKSMAAAIIARVSTDCRIGAPVAALAGTDATHFADCFNVMVGGAFQCPGVSYVAGTTVDSQNRKCRTMAQAHQGMNLRKADFDAFIEDIALEFAAQGLSQDDIRAIAPVFEGARTGVVQTNSQPDRNTYCECPNGLYNGKACTVIVDAGNDADGSDASDAGDSG
jgi:hypothetical protein